MGKILIVISQKLPVANFEWEENLCKFDESFIKNYDQNSSKEYILAVDVEYPKQLHELNDELPSLPERMKIEKCQKRVRILYDNEKHFAHMKILKQKLNHKSWISNEESALDKRIQSERYEY